MTPNETSTRSQMRLVVAGSVDDGKSTLVGRLLHDTKSILADQFSAIERASAQRGAEDVDLALLTDGLRAEREQGITIDVAYRYFSTPKRSFILADTPGHTQYTKNTVTGASTADAALILVDAKNGFSPQSRRHLALMRLLRVQHVIIAINKMDLVGWSRSRFDEIRTDAQNLADAMSLQGVHVIPISALTGANVANLPDDEADWYTGITLLEILETLDVETTLPSEPFRFPVQIVIRPRTRTHPDYRGLGGRIASGTISVGDSVVASPSNCQSTIKGIDTASGPSETAHAGQSVTLLLADELDIGRGQVLSRYNTGEEQVPRTGQRINAVVCWLDEMPSNPTRRFLIKIGTSVTRAEISNIATYWDIENSYWKIDHSAMELNDIATIAITLAETVAYDTYASNRTTGGFLLIDPVSGATVAIGMVGAVQDGDSLISENNLEEASL